MNGLEVKLLVRWSFRLRRVCEMGKSHLVKDSSAPSHCRAWLAGAFTYSTVDTDRPVSDTATAPLWRSDVFHL